MTKRVLFTVVVVMFALNALPAVAATCESLSSLSLPNATVTMAQSVAAGAFTPPAGGRGGGGNPFADLPAFCRVAVTMKPSSESDIKMEIWLPASGWNQKFQAVGNGGWNGNIDVNAIAGALRRGYAAASTDTGHQGGGGPWMQSQEKLIDFGHRAMHELALKSKAIIKGFYETNPQYSYFVGCSAGGRQGLKAAQMHPEDFDGIVAGAPALNSTGRAAFSMYVAQNLRKEEGSFIPNTKYPAIHGAVLQACDARDGVTDKVLENPRQCKFNPQTLLCKDADSASCLTSPQVESAQKMYQPLVNSQTKKVIFQPLELGSELGWNTFGGQQPFAIGVQMYQQMVFKDTNWDFKTLNFGSDMALVDKIENGVINAMNPNLKGFFGRGGKLIQYHGWSDPQIPAGSSVSYYQSVLDTMGGVNRVKENHRLFMVPGMNHCGGGEGPSSFDMLAALEQWVEGKKAPDFIPAAHLTSGKPDRTRILCPYPQVASYKGSGATNDAANFVCK